MMRQNRATINLPITFCALLFTVLTAVTDAYIFGNRSKFIFVKNLETDID